MVLFVHPEVEISSIFTQSFPPTYTFIAEFQSAIDDNTMAMTAPSTDLGLISLTMKQPELTGANVTIYIDRFNLDLVPNIPSRLTAISTPATHTRSA